MFRALGVLIELLGDIFGPSRWGMRPGPAAIIGFVTGVFALVAIVLLLLGFDLASVDVWLSSHASLWDAIGTVLFKIVLGVFFLMGLAICAQPFLDRWGGGNRKDARPGVPDQPDGPDGSLEAKHELPRRPPPAKKEAPAGVGTFLIGLIIVYFTWVGIVNPL